MSFFGIVTRFLVLVFGILVPARRTYNALGSENLTDWAKYWIVYACLLCLELLGDTFFSWMPLYVESKLLIVLWLVMFAPQASGWIFQTILDPFMWRYMPQIDEILMNGKRDLLHNAVSYTTQFCTRGVESVKPIVSQIWKKPVMQPTQVVDSDEANAAQSHAQSQDVEIVHRNEFHDDNVEDEAPDREMNNSLSNIPLMPTRRNMSKLSLPALTTKGPHMNRFQRGQLVHDQVTATPVNNEDILFDIEDLLKREPRAIDLHHLSARVRKNMYPRL